MCLKFALVMNPRRYHCCSLSISGRHGGPVVQFKPPYCSTIRQTTLHPPASAYLVMNENSESELLQELRRTNDLLARLVRTHNDWKLQLRQGLLTGFGGVIGATLLVSLVVWVLKPFEGLEALKPTLDNISKQLERGPK